MWYNGDMGKPRCRDCGEPCSYGAKRCWWCHVTWRKLNSKFAARLAERNPSRYKGVIDRWIGPLLKKRRQQAKWKRQTRTATQRWFDAHPGKRAQYSRQHRARLRGASGSHDVEQFWRLCEALGDKCLCCGRSDVELTEDHVVPLSKGGSDDISNIQPLCAFCNNSKGAKTVDHRPSDIVTTLLQLF